MANKKYAVDPKPGEPLNTVYKFTLQEDTVFHGYFNQTSIQVKPAHFNGMPIDLAVVDITKIQRKDDPGWKISRKLKYFIFVLADGTKIAGLPNCNVLSVSVPFIEICNIEVKNILAVEKVVGEA